MTMQADLNASFRVRMTIKFDDYVTRDHRVHDVRLLPGVVFIDLIHRILKAKGYQVPNISLESILFKQPVSVSENHDSLLEFNFENVAQGHWKVSACSWHIQGERKLFEEAQQNLQAEFRLIETPESLPALDVEAFKASAERVIDTAETYVEAAKMEIVHGPFMKGYGKVYFQGGKVLAELELGDLAASYQDYFVFHPAFLDSSTVMLTVFYMDSSEVTTAIPFYIQSFQCFRSYGKKIYVYLNEDDQQAKGDTFFNDLYYFDEDGQYIGTMQRITVKVVREKQSIQKLANQPQQLEAPTALPKAESTSVVQQSGNTVEQLRELVGSIAKRTLNESEDTEGFYDLGLESSDLLEIVAALEGKLGRKLYPTLLFEYATIAELADYLDELGFSLGGVAVTAPAAPSSNVVAPSTPQSTVDGLLQMMTALFPDREGEFVVADGFYDQGLESTDLLEVVAALEAKYERKFYPTLLFEYSTPQDLAGYLDEEVGPWPGEAVSATVSATAEPSQTLCFQTHDEAVSIPNKTERPKTLVCFDRDGSLVAQLREDLGDDTLVIQVKPGRGFAEDGADCYKVNPKNEADYEALLEALVKRELEVSTCIHAWTTMDWANDAGPMARVLHQVFYAYVFWARAFLKLKGKHKLKWLLVYRHDAEKEQVHFNAFRGALRTMAEESPRLVPGLLAWHGTEAWPQTTSLLRLLGAILPGLEYRLEADDSWAVREFEEVALPDQSDKPMREGGVYLITGGAAGLGLMTARWLARDYKAKLILCGRSAAGERSQNAIEQLEALGGQAIYVAADVASKSDLRKVIKQGRKAFGGLNGVFHAAGVLRDAYVMEKTAEEIDTVLPPKIRASLYLHEMTVDDDLDCFVLFSSLSASAGNAGQVDYAYGNGFMDAFAKARQAQVANGARKGKTLSINWPLWDGGGMHVDEPTARGLASLGLELMREEVGMDAMFRLLEGTHANVTVLHGQAQAIRNLFVPQKQKQAAEPVSNVEASAPTAVQPPPAKTAAPKASYPQAATRNPAINDEPIAVIGISGRYPKAQDLAAFWDNLTQGLDCVTEVPPERWDVNYLFNPDKDMDLIYGKFGGFIEDAECFDARFFNLPPRMMKMVDPQERIFLESSWHAFEDAGYSADQLNGQKVGVFAGVMWAHYQMFGLEETLKGNPMSPTSLFSSVANRVSYTLNLHGPSLAVDTMCSSSLTAMHLALDSIRTGQCEMALAGGVNLSIHPQKYLFLSQNRMVSPEGKCRAFGKDGEGYVPGEGVGVLVLKPLSKALADGDFVYATVIANRLNHGGKTSGYTVPSPVAQGALIAETLEESGIEPQSISYLETHGTGTSLGDPIEITGLNRGFKGAKLAPKSVPIGSVKPNIGHLESAAGIASVTKLLLQFKHRALVPSIHSDPLNPNIDWDDTPFYVNHEHRPWVANKGYALRAGVSAFGAGGSNAHLIFEEVADDDAGQIEIPLFLLSARDEERLQAYATRIHDWIVRCEAKDALPALHRLLFSSQVGRTLQNERLVIFAQSYDQLRQALAQFTAQQVDEHYWHGSIEKQVVPEDATAWVQHQRWADLAQYWIRGGNIDFTKFYQIRPRKVPFPGYPFKKDPIWLDLTPGQAGLGQSSLHLLLDQNVSTLQEQAFSKTLRSRDWCVAEHRVTDKPMLPGTFYAEMARVAAGYAIEEGQKVSAVRDLQWLRPVTAEGDDPATVKVVLIPDRRSLAFEVVSGSADHEVLHAQGELELGEPQAAESIDLFAIKDRLTAGTINSQAHYEMFVANGFDYGMRFRTVDEVMLGEGEALAVLQLKGDEAQDVAYALFLDGAMQVGAHLLDEDGPNMIPSGIQRIEYAASIDAAKTLYAHVQRVDDEGDSAVFAIRICDDQGQVYLAAEQFALSPMAHAKPKSVEVRESAATPEVVAKPAQVDSDQLRRGINQYLKDMVATESGLDTSEIQDDIELENIGIDSVMIMAFNATLENHFDDLSKTLFFEYQTVAELTEFFLKHHGETFRSQLGLDAGAATTTAAAPAKASKPVKPAAKKVKRRQRFSGGGMAAPREIAIVGLAGKYPKANDLEAFWQNLKAGMDCIQDIPKSRFNAKLYFDPEMGKPGRLYCDRGGFIDDPDQFDPLFFGIPPVGAVMFDPQERLFLETAWQALEDAGYSRKAISGQNIGVFVGAMWSEYQLLGIEEEIAGEAVNTSSMFSSIANRVSYFLNLHGPSMAIDTMCSSSITALQLACNAIQQGQCEAAFAGGVNLSLHPHKFLHLAEGRFAAPDGRCRAFGADGSGYVPGEGVGAVLLKPLDQAERDGDNIYAVIRGSALNHGGKTNGYTVPSPVAQGNLIRQVLQDADMELADLDYIECHGTGTALGDPIEINGLLRAYEESRPVKRKIPIGSVKSNIGHLESAAGISQLTKVLLQMKHGQLVPSLHSQPANPNINFAKSPFKVQTQLENWQTEESRPVRAAISSFGAGGSNGHVILEHYLRPLVEEDDNSPQLVLCSAESEAQVVQYAEKMLHFLRGSKLPSLRQIAFTTQVGREPLRWRLVLQATNLEQLRQQLNSFIEKRKGSGIWFGDSEVGKANNSDLVSGDFGKRVMELAMADGDWQRLAKLWVNGNDIDWMQSYDADHLPGRVSLPTYPFNYASYYYQPSPGYEMGSRMKPLDPLVDRNLSDLEVIRFQKQINEGHWFCDDHRIGGRALLPGVIFLEIAKRAASQLVKQGVPIAAQHLVWHRPFVATGRRDLFVDFLPAGDGLEFQLTSGEQQQVLHAEGVIQLGEAAESHVVDLAAFQSACSQRSLDREAHYAQFRKLGFDYGLAFRLVDRVDLGVDQAVVQLRTLDETPDYARPALLLEGALQACMHLLGDETGPCLPYAIDQIHWLGSLPGESCIALLRRLPSAADEPAFAIQLCHANGQVFCDVEGFRLREAELPQAPLEDARQFYVPNWVDHALPDAESLQDVVWYFGENPQPQLGTRVLQFNPESDQAWGDAAWIQQIVDQHQLPSAIVVASPNRADLDQASLQASFFHWFHLLKACMQKPGSTALRLVHVTTSEDDLCSFGLASFMRTINEEQPKWFGSVVVLDSSDEAATRVRAELTQRDEVLVRYRNGVREVERWQLASQTALEEGMSNSAIFDAGDRVLITGGLGGLGLAFARALGAHGVHLLLCGRGQLKADRLEKLEALRAEGVHADYVQLDVTDAAAVEASLKEVVQQFGGLEGIIHSAGLQRDAFLIKKDPEEAMSVVVPKVLGTHYLDQATQDLPLKAFFNFSSVSGALGNAGQCDYAFANAFMDHFANWRNQAQRTSLRQGVCYSINWPLWLSGMGDNPELVKQIEAALGWQAMTDGHGVAALETIADLTPGRVMVVQGKRAGLDDMMAPFCQGSATAEAATSVREPKPVQQATPAPVLESQAAQAAPSGGDDALRKAMVQHLREMVAQESGMAAGSISETKSLEDYGIDSVMITSFNATLNEQFEKLSKTLFFEYQTVGELADYFMAEHRAEVETLFGQTVKSSTPTTTASVDVARAQPVKQARPIAMRSRLQSSGRGRVSQDVAIVGVAGRYPNARDLATFWQNLVNGNDCIVEVPAERWDIQRYFEGDRGKAYGTFGRWGGFIEGLEKFDPLFFNMSPGEADITDPQERIFLQTAWEAMEDSGYTREVLAQQRTGVYVGVMWNEHNHFGVQDALRKEGASGRSSTSSIANRASYALNLNGPSIGLDTMCSSSLTSLHFACRAIQNGDCDMAIAGGVNVSIHPAKYLTLANAGFLASDGRCRSFGEGGDGYVPGEGVGALILKPLTQAQADGDHIYAVVKGSGLNHGGKTNGYTVPNPKAQGALIRQVLDEAKIDAKSISFVETHGTGTALGDPIEITGLTQAFKPDDVPAQSVPIGSLKSVMGHLESAAGVAAITKVLMQFKHKMLPPSLHSKQLNPNIDFEQTPFYVQQKAEAWVAPNNQNVLRAGVSSYGAGGANAHVILEEPPQQVKQPEIAKPRLVLLSARSQDRLVAYAERFANYLKPLLQPQVETVQTASVDADQIQQQLVSLTAAILQTEAFELDLTTDLAELGLDAIGIQKLTAGLQQQVFDQCSANEIQQRSNLKAVVDYLVDGLSPEAAPEINEALPALRDLAFTTQVGREALNERLALVVESLDDLLLQLQNFVAKPEQSGLIRGNAARSQLSDLIEAEESQYLINAAFERNDLAKLGRLWTNGMQPDWQQLYVSEATYRIPLPTYPFEERICKFPDGETSLIPASGSAQAEALPAQSQLLLPSWQDGSTTSEMHYLKGNVLVLLNDTTAGLEDVLKTHCSEASFKFVAFDAQQAQDHAVGGQVWSALQADRFEFKTLIDFSDLHQQPQAHGEPPLGKLRLLQLWLSHSDTRDLYLRHFTSGLEAEGAQASLAGAGMCGAVETLAAELRFKLNACSIDVDRRDDQFLVETLLREWHVREPAGRLRLHQGRRATPTFITQALKTDANHLKANDGAIVITGGTGGIGAVMAQHLASKGYRKFVLMGVRPLPDRSQWSEVLAANSKPSLCDKIRNIQTLEATGSQVQLYFGSLSDQPALKAYFDEVRQTLGAITGVIHCAGLVATPPGPFVDKNLHDAQDTFEPKVQAVHILRELFAKDNLQFFYLFSSMSGVLPRLGAGMIDYAVANAYLDRFAHYCQQQGDTVVQSVQWPNWKEVGMGERPVPLLDSFGIQAMHNHEALHLFDHLGTPGQNAQILPGLVKPGGVSAQQWRWIESAKKSAAKQTAQASSKPKTSSPKASSVEAFTLDYLLELFGSELRMERDQLDAATNFDEYGIDSIFLAEIVRKMEPWLGASVDPSAILENPTLNGVVEFLLEEHGSLVKAKYGEADDVGEAEVASPAEAEEPTSADYNAGVISEVRPAGARPRSLFAEPEKPKITSSPGQFRMGDGQYEKIAIIGMSGHFPGADNLATYWDNLKKGVFSVKVAPKTRWDVDAYYSPEPAPGKTVSKWGGYLENIEDYDPDYFRIRQEEAASVDPLIRQFLEVSAECFNHAGYSRKELANTRTGVYCGTRVASWVTALPPDLPVNVAGTGQNFIGAHISHFYNLKGPNITLDTACSSSLTAIHLACQSLMLGESDMALAGGVDLLLNEAGHLSLSSALSPDGKCHTFAENANGFVPGEGAGAVLLKPLSQAVADGDRVYAVVEASAVNNDGATMGITTPNPEMQRAVIQEAMRVGGIDASSMGYLEAHGTGTLIGDPIELKALTKVFRKQTDENQFCAVGSVKTNFGHLLSAAGMASTIKVVLSIMNKKIPPTLHCETPNPRFKFDTSPFFPNTKLSDWQQRGGTRRAGISGFGFGGTNAHIIIGEATPWLPAGYMPQRAPLPPIQFNRRRFWPWEEGEVVQDAKPSFSIKPPEQTMQPAMPQLAEDRSFDLLDLQDESDQTAGDFVGDLLSLEDESTSDGGDFLLALEEEL